MKKERINMKGISLLEVLLAALIFVLTVAGVFYTLTAVRNPVVNKESALTAAIFGKQILEALDNNLGAAANTDFYANLCNSGTSTDGACEDFSLLYGPHEVPSATLSSLGITWPTSLTSSNSCAGVTGTCLTYNVSCGDGSVATAPNWTCQNANVAKKVDLQINWPSTTS